MLLHHVKYPPAHVHTRTRTGAGRHVVSRQRWSGAGKWLLTHHGWVTWATARNCEMPHPINQTGTEQIY